MAAIINLTPQQPVGITATPGPAPVLQNLWEAVDIAAFDFLDLELVVLAVGGSVGASSQMNLITGMQTQTEDGWVVHPTTWVSAGSIAAGVVVLKTFDKGLLRYVRWKYSPTSTTDIVTFYIRGMARRYGTP